MIAEFRHDPIPPNFWRYSGKLAYSPLAQPHRSAVKRRHHGFAKAHFTPH
jgi:hypothetical protein